MRNRLRTVTTVKATIGEIKSMALVLWNEGYRGDKQGRPLDKNKPLIPSVIAARCEVSLPIATQINHLLAVWSLGTVPVGEYDKI